MGNKILARKVNDGYTVTPGQYSFIHIDLGASVSDSLK
jgi:hypothetical protein